MISRKELENTNTLMIGRGVPEERDNFGYNIPDYNKLSSIWYGATNNDLFEISSRLLKYYDTQLEDVVDFTKEELIETIEYYDDLSNANIVKNSITLGFTKDLKTVAISFKYNDEYINVMRLYKYRFDRELKVWEGNSAFIVDILNVLSEIGADVENALRYVVALELDNNISFAEASEKEYAKQINSKNVLIVNEVDDDNVSLEFDYDDYLVQSIRKLRAKRFDWDEKVWIVSKFELENLYENIQFLDYDFSQLKAYLNEVLTPKVKIIDVSKKDIEISFPYFEEVVSSIKRLDYYKYKKQTKTWIIDIREKSKLIDLIKDMIDCSELEEISYEEAIEKVSLRDYSYLERKPFKHQYEAANFLLDKRKTLLADEMGSGKSLTSVLASFSLPSPRLVICPASIKLNWAKEIRMVDYEGDICVIGDKEIEPNADWYIINYDILEREYKTLKNIDFSCITLDEVHYIKAVNNSGKAKSKRGKYAMALAENIDFVFSLSGTPITNKPKDIFNVLKISDHILSRNFFSFAQEYCGPTHNGFGWNFDGSSNEAKLHEQIKPMMLRRLKKDMLDLPEKVRRFIPVEINLLEYQRLINEYFRSKGKLATEAEHLAYLNALKHILATENALEI